MKRILIFLLLICISTMGFCQTPQVKFLLQPDRTFKTEDGNNKIDIDFKGFSIGSLHSTALMAAQYVGGQPCSLVEGKSINIHQYEFYAQGNGHSFTYVFNFCFLLSPNEHKITILAPRWDHTIYDGRLYYWSKTVFFDKENKKQGDAFLLEGLVNNFLNDFIATIVDNTSR